MLVELSINNQRVITAYNTLAAHVDLNKRSLNLVTVVQDGIESTDELVLLTADESDMTKWSPSLHWARFLLQLKATLVSPSNSIFDNARIRGQHPTWGALWIISKIILRNRRPNDLQRLTRKFEARAKTATRNALLATTAGATLGGMSIPDAAKAAMSAAQTMSSKGPSTLSRVKRHKATPYTGYRSDDEPEDNLSDTAGAGGDMSPQGAISIDGLEEEDIVAAYIKEMERIEVKMSEDPLQKARQEKAARSLKEMARSLHLRPVAKKAHFRNGMMLFDCAHDHMNDISHIRLPNKRKNPIRRRLDEERKNSVKVAACFTGASEENASPSNDVLSALVEEEAQEIENRDQNRNDQDGSENADEEQIVVKPTNTVPEPEQRSTTYDLFKASHNNAAFAPSYLREACLEAKITDMNKKLMPGMNFPLRWWQVIALKWMSDLWNGPNAPPTKGGIMADQIGLGKTIQAGGLICKVRRGGHLSKFTW